MRSRAARVTCELPLDVRSVHGDSSMSLAGSGRPRSRSAIAVTSVRLPPAESPPITRSLAAMPSASSAE